VASPADATQPRYPTTKAHPPTGFDLVIEDAGKCAPRQRASAEAEVFRTADGRVAAVAYRRAQYHCLRIPSVGTFCFAPNLPEVRLFRESGAHPEHVEDTYFRVVLPIASQLHGRQVLHASAVLLPQGIVALCGRSGDGKSTLAYGLSQRGFPMWADDAVSFRATPGGATVHPLPFRLRLRPTSADWFGLAANMKGFERTLSWCAGTDVVPFRALIVLDRRGLANAQPEVKIERLSPADAFTAVLPHAYYLSLRDSVLKRNLASGYLDLANQVPVFSLRFVPRLQMIDNIADAIHDSVASL
jgi:hypothetical protein